MALPILESLIYVSEPKLMDLAVSRGISTDRVVAHRTKEHVVRASLPVAPGTKWSTELRSDAERCDPEQPERRLARTIATVVRSLSSAQLPDLDAGQRTPRDGEWFRFHRDLRFGYGCADDDHSVAALVLVDRDAVDEQGRAGLLMTGSPWHLRHPYRPQEGTEIHGARSGSATGRLFAWLESVRAQRESLGGVPTDAGVPHLFRRDDPPDGHDTPIDMYRLFAQDGWMSRPRFAQFVNPAPCEGVARVSLVSAGADITVVMASPLYVRVLSIPQPEEDPAADGRDQRRFPRLRRQARQPRATT